MTHLAATSEQACVAGRIDVLVYGDPGPRPRVRSKVIHSPTRLDIDLAHACQGKQFIYIALGANWTTDPRALQQRRLSPQLTTPSRGETPAGARRSTVGLRRGLARASLDTQWQSLCRRRRESSHIMSPMARGHPGTRSFPATWIAWLVVCPR